MALIDCGPCLAGAAGEKYVPVKIDENDLHNGVLNLLKSVRPNWAQGYIKLKTLTEGITNKLVSCQYLESSDENDIMLVRIYGNKTDLFIDRTAEIRNIKTLNALGLAPQLYATFENGLAYQYYPGNTLDVKSVYNVDIWPLVATQMAKMHRVQLGDDVPKEPFIWNKIEQFLNLLPDPFTSEDKQARFAKSFGSITKLREEYERLKSFLINTKSPIVFAHNDLLLGNVIYNKAEKKISFIDYEYAAYCYQAYDIANHFNEFVGLSIDDIDYDSINYPEPEFQKVWIKVYLATYLDVCHPTDMVVYKVYNEVQQLSLLSHFLWGIWSLVQYEHSDIDFDFGRYAEIRLNRYNELKYYYEPLRTDDLCPAEQSIDTLIAKYKAETQSFDALIAGDTSATQSLDDLIEGDMPATQSLDALIDGDKPATQAHDALIGSDKPANRSLNALITVDKPATQSLDALNDGEKPATQSIEGDQNIGD